MLAVSIFIGEFGIDQFMIGDIGRGVLKLLTFGGCLVLWIMDLFTIKDKTKESNFNELVKALY